MNDINVYLGGQKGRVPLQKEWAWALFFQCLSKCWISELLQMENLDVCYRTKMNKFWGGLGIPSLSVYLGRHWHHSHDRNDQAFSLHFVYCKQSKTELWEGLEKVLLIHKILGSQITASRVVTKTTLKVTLGVTMFTCGLQCLQLHLSSNHIVHVESDKISSWHMRST